MRVLAVVPVGTHSMALTLLQREGMFRFDAAHAFFLLLGFPWKMCSGVFIGENAHRGRSPGLHTQGKCSERANREPAAGVSLQVFDVGSGSEARFFERLHRAMAVFAAHELVASREGFVDSAGEPTPTSQERDIGHSANLLTVSLSQCHISLHILRCLWPPSGGVPARIQRR